MKEEKMILVLGDTRRWYILDSILTSIKKLLGIAEECKDFDTDLILHINSVFMILTQMGIGPKEGFSIEDDSATWDDFLLDSKNLDAVKTYVHLKVKLVFDPSASSVVTEAMNKMISELEWRLYVASGQY